MQDLKRIRPVAAADYFNRNAVIAFVSGLLFNILPIERKHICREQNPLDDLRESLKKGESLIVFPEGTRSLTGDVGSFHTGIAHLVKEFPRVPVVPVYLSNMGRALPKGEFILLPFICEVNVGEPVFPQGSKEEIMSILRQEILKLRKEASWGN